LGENAAREEWFATRRDTSRCHLSIDGATQMKMSFDQRLNFSLTS